MGSRGRAAVEPSARQVLVWAVLTFLMAGAAGATGYLAAGPAELAAADPPPPRLLQVDDIYASGRADGARAARKTAFARGRRAGYRAGRRAAGDALELAYRPGGPGHARIFDAGHRDAVARFDFGADGFYVVGVRDGGRHVDASHGPLRADASYELCRSGGAVCFSDAAP